MGYGTNRNTARMMELLQTKVVHIQENQQNVHPHPAEFLQGDKGTRLVSDQDKGSRPKYASVEVQGELNFRSGLRVLADQNGPTEPGEDCFLHPSGFVRIQSYAFWFDECTSATFVKH